MAITRTPMVDDDGSGTTGTVINNAWKTELYNQIDAALPAALAPVAHSFNAADYSAQSPMTLTVTAGQVSTNIYSINGKQVTWAVMLGPGTLGGTASTAVYIRLPGGLFATNLGSTEAAVATCADGAGSHLAQVRIPAGASQATIYVNSGAAWTLGSLFLNFTVTFFSA